MEGDQGYTPKYQVESSWILEQKKGIRVKKWWKFSKVNS